MRDPFQWSIPLFRAFGIQVRLHILYILITIALIGRQYHVNERHLTDFILIWVVMLFGIILLHEFGHCFAARREGGDAEEILIWPLGGLAYCEVPHSARAHFVTAAGGPFVNVLICLACTAILFPLGYLPPMNPYDTQQLVAPELHHWSDGKTHVPESFAQEIVVRPGTDEVLAGKIVDVNGTPIVFVGERAVVGQYKRLESYSEVVLWVARLHWMSWMLLLFNLLPAYPLDGGRLLQAALWSRWNDYRRATRTAVTAGYIVATGLLLSALILNETMLMALAIFMILSCRAQWMQVEAGGEESVFGYDFSQGYTSLEKDEPQPIPAKKVGWFTRWKNARTERRTARETEERLADEARLDELLDKVHRNGKQSLSEEERRFMDRVSARYRNRS